MKRRKIDSSRERRALIALITSKRYLARAAKGIDLDLIEAPHFKQVAEWCLEYWNTYGKAPGDHIEDLYHSWSDGNENRELVDAVHDFLDGLSKEYARADQLNVPFLLDELDDLMSTRRLQRIKDDLEYALSKGQTKEAKKLLREFKAIEVGEQAGYNPMRQNWKEVFADPLEPVISFEGDAGDFFNTALTRDALVGIQAPEKSGKTQWVMEFVFRGLRQRRKVALFQCGDLSKKQVDMRMAIRWAKRPLWESQVKKGIIYPTEIQIESQKDREEDEEEKGKKKGKKSKTGWSVEGGIYKPPGVVTKASVVRGIRKFRRACGLAEDEDYLKVSVHANSSVNVAGIEAVLDQWLYEEDFIPDLILIDYADILAPEETPGRKPREDRNVINETWKALRRLSQKRHALVVVPTQTNASVYGRGKGALQSMKSFSEDKRKYAHVTAMFGINQTPEEKEMQGMRLNWIVQREAPYSMVRPLYVGTCYALGRALCVAKLG